jgi:hypothetical protein
MIDLTKEEKNYVLDLSRTYKEMHSEIGEIEKKMRDFSEKAEILIKDLEEKRSEELNFLDQLSEKYGKGQIDIFTLKWKKIEENEKSEASY